MKSLTETLKLCTVTLEQKIENSFAHNSFLQQIANDYNYMLPNYSDSGHSLPAILAQSSIYHLLCLEVISDRRITEQIKNLERQEFLDSLVKELYEKSLLIDALSVLEEIDFRDILRQSFLSFEPEALLSEIHFELSLKRENERKRVVGAYHTPEAIASFITRSVDKILKNDFEELSEGLASVNPKNGKPYVKILDPATGIGTFLSCAIDNIEQTIKSSDKNWNDYVSSCLLPSINGFEVYLPSYAFARLNIIIKLFRSGYDFSDMKWANILLIDTLSNPENTPSPPENVFARDLAKAAALIKRDESINVIICNPPFTSAVSSRETYQTPRESIYNKPLQDAYVQFLHFSHSQIQRTGRGVIGVITNNKYLSSPIFRKMRESWLEFFSKIYILNLHGDIRTSKKSPTGDKDENILGIQVGLSIALLIKTKKSSSDKPSRVLFYDLWGTSSEKIQYLSEHEIDTIDWKELRPFAPSFYFNSLSEPLDIKLQENGLHSLKKGINSYQEFLETSDYWLLKESIMFFNHGVELLMKDVLARQNDYLIFDSLGEVAKKKLQVKEPEKSVFDLENPPKTINFEEALTRVRAFLKPTIFDDELLANLRTLNKLRNKIEHHEVLLDGQTVQQLIDAIREPLGEFLKTQGVEASFLDLDEVS